MVCLFISRITTLTLMGPSLCDARHLDFFLFHIFHYFFWDWQLEISSVRC